MGGRPQNQRQHASELEVEVPPQLTCSPYSRTSPILFTDYIEYSARFRRATRRLSYMLIGQRLTAQVVVSFVEGRQQCAVLHWRPRWSRYSFRTWGHPGRSKPGATSKKILSPT